MRKLTLKEVDRLLQFGGRDPKTVLKEEKEEIIKRYRKRSQKEQIKWENNQKDR